MPVFSCPPIDARVDAAQEREKEDLLDVLDSRKRLIDALRAIRDVEEKSPCTALAKAVGIAAVALAQERM